LEMSCRRLLMLMVWFFNPRIHSRNPLYSPTLRCAFTCTTSPKWQSLHETRNTRWTIWTSIGGRSEKKADNRNII
jgi:hypothetical protein